MQLLVAIPPCLVITHACPPEWALRLFRLQTTWFGFLSYSCKGNVNPSLLPALGWTHGLTSSFHYEMKSPCLLEMHQLLVPTTPSQFISQSLEKLERTEATDKNTDLPYQILCVGKDCIIPRDTRTREKVQSTSVIGTNPKKFSLGLNCASSV